jgi:peptide/nickel transport system permease protein
LLGFISRRLLQLVPVVVGITVLTFGLMTLIPGDPAQAILGSYATPQNLHTLRAELKLSRPLPEQYVSWISRAAQGDLGRSYSLDRPVLGIVVGRFRATLLLAGAALFLCVLFGTCAGVVASVWRQRWPDRVLTTSALVGLSVPSFWLAMLFVVLFSVKLGWFPSGGMRSPGDGGGLLDLLHHLVLPAFALAMVASGVIARLTRSSMLEVLHQDYLRTARAKGVPERVVIVKHAFRNALGTIVPVIGVQAGFLLGGAIYIETVFNWPGVGSMLVDAIERRDILLVQGGVLVVAVSYVLINLAADVLQAAVDPRIRTR